MTFQRILVAIDHSLLTSRVFKKALDIAQSEKANLMIFHCLDAEEEVDIGIPIQSGSGIDIYQQDLVFERQFYQESFQSKVVQVEAWLQTYVQKAKDLGIPTQYKHDAGNTGSTICELASDWGADLIIIGRKEHKGFTEFFMGSVSNYVVHHANCSVLVIQ